MRVLISILAVMLCWINGCSKADPEKVPTAVETGLLKGKKILLVDSYHPEYLRSMMVLGELKKFAQKEHIELQVVYLDEKHVKDDAILREAASSARHLIDSWHPDVVIAAEDPANKYVVSEYYKDAALPIIFTGVNWEISQYGYPCKNVTGQIEIEFPEKLIEELRSYAKGSRIGLITGDTLTDRKVCNYYENDLKIPFFKKYFVNSFNEWKSAYLALQKDVDILFFRNNSGISGWNDGKARTMILEQTIIPTGSVIQQMAPFVLINYSKVNIEFGQYAAQTAREILSGTPPSEIPITTNKQLQVYLNMPLAKKLGIVFSMNLIEQSTFVTDGLVDETSID